MKRFLLMSGLAILWLAPPLEAASTDCVPDRGCPKDTGPPSCCQPPPCEFFEQIRMKKAVKRLFSQPEVRKKFIRQANGDNAKAAKKLNDWVVAEAAKLGKGLRCPWTGQFSSPPSFHTNSSCQIVAELPEGEEAMGRDTAISRTNSCSEFIDAIYNHEQVHKDICLTTNSSERANEGISVYAQEERAGYTKEIQSLNDSLLQYWRACSITFSADTARRVAKYGLGALQNAKQTDGPPKIKPKRAGKKGAKR